MTQLRLKFRPFCKFLPLLLALAACSTNPATGARQFTALMSPAQEDSTGAQEHEKIMQTYGSAYDGTPLQQWVNEVGQRVARDTERPDVQYKFFVLDTPSVNAFALPGGYVYVTRGLLALANSEDELAGVLAHEVGHITARHSAERYSRGVLASVGAAALSIALDSPDVGRAADLGSQLYMASYSRGQESEADRLGVRYLSRAGYDPSAMARFLSDMGRSSALESALANKAGGGFDFFATHPQTADRVTQAEAEAGRYPARAPGAAAAYLSRIDGLTYGDSPAQGMVRGASFYHPALNLTFSVPEGFRLANDSAKVTAAGPDGSILIFDGAPNPSRLDAASYLTGEWLKNKAVGPVESISIAGRPAASVSFPASLDGAAVTIRLIAVRWTDDRFYRFQAAIPAGTPGTVVDGLKRATYSLREMTEAERGSIRPLAVRAVAAEPSDTAASLAARMAFADHREERFRVLNGMNGTDAVKPGQTYKLIVQ